MGPTPNGSSTLQHFEHGNALEIRNGIMFDFYPGLQHVRLLFEILSVSRLEIVLLPRGCHTTWLVIFMGTNFYDTGQNSILEIFAVDKSGTHKLGSCMTKS